MDCGLKIVSFKKPKPPNQKPTAMLTERSSGILLHVTSLPSRHGIGDLGDTARKFVDFLAGTHQKYWQVLPLTPLEQGLGNSPYSSQSVFAGNTLLISLDKLQQDGWLETADINTHPSFPPGRVDFPAVRLYKEPLFDKAFETFQRNAGASQRAGFGQFCQESDGWLDDFSLYACLTDLFEYQSWSTWEGGLADREPETMERYRVRLHPQIQREKFLQYVFYKQWNELKAYANQKNVRIFGDLPIYTDYNSADVWANQGLFQLDGKRPVLVAGTPPDYFNADGQIWGLPLYDWHAAKETGFAWWMRRIRHNLNLFDLLRLDHFLGFVNYFAIPAQDFTAENGMWVQAPAEDFFETLFRTFPDPPIVAEDLGILSARVVQFIEHYRLPGMKVLQFAFTGEEGQNPYLPHNHPENCAVYTATHDNNTTKGWWRTEAEDYEKHRLQAYMNAEINEHSAATMLMTLAMHCRANLAILTMQDLLNLDESARMNTPGIGQGNWEWQAPDDWHREDMAGWLRWLTGESRRG